jgi:hypothetical protein
MAKKTSDEGATSAQPATGGVSVIDKQPEAGEPQDEELVIPNWDRFHRRSKPGDIVQLYGFSFDVKANGDVHCMVKGYAVEGMLQAGRAIRLEDHRNPQMPATDQEAKDAANKSRILVAQ